MKLLIVDDDIEVLKILGNAFITLLKGYQVQTAFTANQGLNLIKAERPDVIIMDVRLGPESGMDLLEDYSKHTTGYNPRIIVITAYDDEKVRKRAEELKVDAFILKPLHRETLLVATLRAIKKQLESQLSSVDLVLKGLEGKKMNGAEVHGYLDEKKKSSTN